MPILFACGVMPTVTDRAEQGSFSGGDGLIREVELLADAQVTLLADRRKLRPYGLQGGEEGAAGRASLHSAGSPEATELPGKCSRRVSKGDILHIETPGGGGWGEPSSSATSNPSIHQRRES